LIVHSVPSPGMSISCHPPVNRTRYNALIIDRLATHRYSTEIMSLKCLLLFQRARVHYSIQYDSRRCKVVTLTYSVVGYPPVSMQSCMFGEDMSCIYIYIYIYIYICMNTHIYTRSSQIHADNPGPVNIFPNLLISIAKLSF